MDEAGKVLAKRRLPEGAAGIAQLHGLVGGMLGEDADDAEVLVGIETDRGPWAAALVAAGYQVFPGPGASRQRSWCAARAGAQPARAAGVRFRPPCRRLQ